MKKALGTMAALLWILFWIALVIRLMAGDGGMLAAEMLKAAPPEASGLPEKDYPGVCEMTAGYLTGKTDTFQYVIPEGEGAGTECFRPIEAAHMADCRSLIHLDGMVCAACLAAAGGLTAAGLAMRRGRESFLRGILWGLRIACALACAMIIWAMADFDGLFVTFHRVAFRNDGWLLDPRTDLLIRLMPERFFIRLGIRGGMRALAGAAGIALAAGLARGRKRGNAEKNT